MLKKCTYVHGPWTSWRPKAKKLREGSCFMSISLLILWLACNWVSSCVATLVCCDTNTWNWATHSLWCLLLLCSLNVGIAFFQFWKPWMVKAGSIFLLIPRPLLVQQWHCVQYIFPLVSHNLSQLKSLNHWYWTDLAHCEDPVPCTFLVFISTAGSCGWLGFVRSPQHSLVQWLSVAWLEAGGEQLDMAWQVNNRWRWMLRVCCWGHSGSRSSLFILFCLFTCKKIGYWILSLHFRR